MPEKRHKISAPYLVELDGGPPISVDPSKLSDEGVQLEHINELEYLLHYRGKTVTVVIEEQDSRNLKLTAGNTVFRALISNQRDQLLADWGMKNGTAADEREIFSPMPGLVLKVLVEEGQSIVAGDPLLVLEAMKMENEIKASVNAVVKSVLVTEGDAVQKNQLLIEFQLESA